MRTACGIAEEVFGSERSFTQPFSPSNALLNKKMPES
ncbi:MAG: hypothetical protein ACJAYJ_002510 [Saprospiraceae bacterium]|jgi:hypothetical protein